MILLTVSAAFVGFIHSLAPGHWIPVVLITKGYQWPFHKRLGGALIASSGHIFTSLLLGTIFIGLGAVGIKEYFFKNLENHVEKYSSLFLILFGLGYVAFSIWNHLYCEGKHLHHGPSVTENEKAPYIFLFLLGFSPCVAALPIFLAASTLGSVAVLFTMLFFSLGVIFALLGATTLVTWGMDKLLDHPLFEHYGDVLVGIGLIITGGILWFF